MAGFSHESVLLAEVLEQLSPQEGELFCDGTLGGAGHAGALVARGVRLIGVDRDPLALATAQERIPSAELHHASYSELPERVGSRKLDGLLLDLGVSSPQLDLAERGFSFSKDGPLDMRMDPTRGQTALEVIRDLDLEDLISILFEYGEERYAKRIAGKMKERVAAGGLQTTLQLAKLCADAIPFAEQRKSKIHPATRTFQALRIAVNAELTELEKLLAALPDLLAPGGRAAIISFHSLEDRLVKNRFRDLAWTTSLPAHLAVQAGERVEPVVEVKTRKPIVAGDDEVARNPRARSAKLRVCVRTAAPNLPSGAPPSGR